jgi:hypothetical protein
VEQVSASEKLEKEENSDAIEEVKEEDDRVADEHEVKELNSVDDAADGEKKEISSTTVSLTPLDIVVYDEEEEEAADDTTAAFKDADVGADEPTKVLDVVARPVKRARTAYFIFTDERRPEVQKQVRRRTVRKMKKCGTLIAKSSLVSDPNSAYNIFYFLPLRFFCVAAPRRGSCRGGPGTGANLGSHE